MKIRELGKNATEEKITKWTSYIQNSKNDIEDKWSKYIK